jgi:subtilisin family serine protease
VSENTTRYTVPGSTEPDEFPNFFGTSASAPHVAAVAALILDRRARDVEAGERTAGRLNLTPELIYGVLRLSASDIRRRDMGVLSDIGLVGLSPGTEPISGGAWFDFDSGFGLVNAERALRLVRDFR